MDADIRCRFVGTEMPAPDGEVGGLPLRDDRVDEVRSRATLEDGTHISGGCATPRMASTTVVTEV